MADNVAMPTDLDLNSQPAVTAAATATAVAPSGATTVATGGEVVSKKKKPPGRPRKKPMAKPIEKLGLVTKPTNPDYIMEFTYDNPNAIKKVFSLLKDMSVQNIKVIFNKKSIVMKARDHMKKNNIKIEIDTRRVNSYYFNSDFLKDNPLSIGLCQERFNRVLSIVGTNTSLFKFISTKQNYRESITTQMASQSDTGIPKIRDSINELISITDDVDFKEDDVDYKLIFELDAKDFKKEIAYYHTLEAQYIDITKDYDDPLTFKCSEKHSKGKHSVKFPSSTKMNLISTLNPAEDLFSVSVKLDYIKQFSSSLISDKIKISAHDEKPMKFEMNVEDDNNKGSTIKVTIWTAIVNYTDDKKDVKPIAKAVLPLKKK